jgi:hypothetical protein
VLCEEAELAAPLRSAVALALANISPYMGSGLASALPSESLLEFA